MIFKPRIFISSTFSDNQVIRKRISKYFLEIGAEPLLYEKNLTPSVLPMTYRANVLDSDFVILIMKGYYGTKTDWNLSGTHEEYRIARDNKIPTHVYLQKLNSEVLKTDNPLTEELNDDQVSYYYFTDENDLLKRLKETTFTIAREIMVKQIKSENLSRNTISKLAINYDYNKSLEIITAIEYMKQLNKTYNIDYINTNIVVAVLGPICDHIYNTEHPFINWILYDKLVEALQFYDKFSNNHVLDYTNVAGKSREINIHGLGEILFCHVSYSKNTELTHNDYHQLLISFFEKYNEFKQYVQDMRLYADIK